MTKEELKQKAEDSLDKMVTDKGIILGCHEGFCYDEVTDFMAEFAEPREKRIDCLTLACENYREEMEKNLAAAVKLEKENAELKEVIDNDVDKKIYVQLAKKAELADVLKEQLTKAKELLEDLIMFQPYINKEAIFLSIGNEWKTAIYKAEQFLNSEVEK